MSTRLCQELCTKIVITKRGGDASIRPQIGPHCEAQMTSQKHALPVNTGYLFRFNCVACHILFSFSFILSLTPARFGPYFYLMSAVKCVLDTL